MPIYVGLYKLTGRGTANIKDAPKRVAATIALAEKMGVRTIGTWLTLGGYDLVSVSEAPDDETVARFALALGQQGELITQSMRAFTLEEFQKLVDDLP